MRPAMTRIAALVVLFAPIASLQADHHGALIAQARSAAPELVSADATVMYRGEVLVEGTNGWVCMPETLPHPEGGRADLDISDLPPGEPEAPGRVGDLHTRRRRPGHCRCRPRVRCDRCGRSTW